MNRLKNIKIGSYSVSTYNLGDHIQILAQLRLMESLGLTPDVYIDRDDEIHSCGKFDALGDDKLFLPMNGWHKTNQKQWPPSDNIIPLFIGFHLRTRPSAFGNVPTSPKSIEYFKNHGPIGCRDLYTHKLLQKYGVDSYISNCLTTTFPTRKKTETQTKIFVSSRNRKLLSILPPNIREECTYINHYTGTKDFSDNMKSAQNLLDNYRDNAKLVITTFLHSALPCIAMGIPVIVFYPNYSENSGKGRSDRERMSTLKTMTRCYNFSEVGDVDWNPDPVDIDEMKSKLIFDFKNKVESKLSE